MRGVMKYGNLGGNLGDIGRAFFEKKKSVIQHPPPPPQSPNQGPHVRILTKAQQHMHNADEGLYFLY